MRTITLEEHYATTALLDAPAEITALTEMVLHYIADCPGSN